MQIYSVDSLHYLPRLTLAILQASVSKYLILCKNLSIIFELYAFSV